MKKLIVMVLVLSSSVDAEYTLTRYSDTGFEFAAQNYSLQQLSAQQASFVNFRIKCFPLHGENIADCSVSIYDDKMRYIETLALECDIETCQDRNEQLYQ